MLRCRQKCNAVRLKGKCKSLYGPEVAATISGDNLDLKLASEQYTVSQFEASSQTISRLCTQPSLVEMITRQMSMKED
jgi:hypothetical protein